MKRTAAVLGVLGLVACSSGDGDKDARQPDVTDLASDLQRDAGRDLRPDSGPRVDVARDAGPTTPWEEVKASVSGSLNAIWGLSATSIYAVGKAGLILHYDGKSWSQMSSSETMDLHAIWGTSDTQLVAVGDNAILVYDGTSWEMDEDYYSWSGDSFRAVWGSSATDVWVAGASGGKASVQHKVSYEWDEVLTSPPSKDLMAMWGQGSDIVVVGKGGVILKKSGSSFAPMSSPVSSDLQAIWGPSAQDLFAVGLDGAIIHCDGTAWTVMPSGSASYLYGVWGASNKDVYAVGQGIFKPEETILHYDGSSWAKTLAPKVAFSAVWGSGATDIYAVSGTRIYHYGGKP